MTRSMDAPEDIVEVMQQAGIKAAEYVGSNLHAMVAVVRTGKGVMYVPGFSIEELQHVKRLFDLDDQQDALRVAVAADLLTVLRQVGDELGMTTAEMERMTLAAKEPPKRLRRPRGGRRRRAHG